MEVGELQARRLRGYSQCVLRDTMESITLEQKEIKMHEQRKVELGRAVKPDWEPLMISIVKAET